MTGPFVVAVVAFPLVLLSISLGLGLISRALTAGAVPLLLVLPVGLAAAYCVTNVLTGWSATAEFAGPATGALAFLGLIVGRGDLRKLWRRARKRRGPIFMSAAWPALAAVATFVAVASPEIFNGAPTWSGFQHLVDIGHQFDLGTYLAAHGRSVPTGYGPQPHSSYTEAVGKFIVTGYPGGGQSLLGSLASLLGAEQAWLWQTFLAFVAAMGSLCAFCLAALIVRSGAVRAAAATIALQANVLYGYTLAGGIKELSTVTFLLLAAALLAHDKTAARVGRGPIPLSLAVAAAFAAINVTVLPWLAVLISGMLLTTLLQAWRRADQQIRVSAGVSTTTPRRHLVAPSIPNIGGVVTWLLGWLEVGALAAFFSIPTINAAVKLLPTRAGFVSGPGQPQDLGNLAAPIPHLAASGVWITGDHRYPLAAHQTVTHVVAYTVVALAVVGLCVAIWRRSYALVWLGLAGAVGLAYVARNYDPWVTFKAECITAPIALLVAFAGAGAIFGFRRLRLFRWLGVAAVAVISAAVLWGNALAYHNTTIAPYARMHDLQMIGDRFAGRGPTLSPSWDEYAEYFLRRMNLISPPDTTFFGVRPGTFAPGQALFNVDTNQLDPAYIQYFRYLVIRRSPTASRPPSDFRLVMRTDFYEVWHRVGGSSSVVSRLPLSGSPTERSPAYCADSVRQARRLGPRGEIAYVRTPIGAALIAPQFAYSPSLAPMGPWFLAHGPGKATASLRLTARGTWSFWLGGSEARPVRVFIDGRPLGAVAYQANYPGQYMFVGSRMLSAGVHTLELLRGGGSLHPGSGDDLGGASNSVIGPLFAVDGPLQQDLPVQRAPVSALPRLCRARIGLEWIELVRPGANAAGSA